jgi:HJR/Mrr/RecB family endonuclease
MSTKTKKKVFISHSSKDKHYVNLLKAQLANSKDVDAIWVDDFQLMPGAMQESINSKITSSSMLLVMVGEHWSRWQEYEIQKALELGIPVAGILAYGNDVIRSPILKSGEVPLVNWTWNNLAAILTGEQNTLEYTSESQKLSESPILRVDFDVISQQLTEHLISNPDAIHQLSPRKFEELVAYLMEKQGYEVTLTKQSRDGGIDIFALKRDGFGNFLTIVDCKRYSEKNLVGIDLVRTMYGTLNIAKASHGIIATTSRFTKDAKVLAEDYKYQISLKDHADITQWIQKTRI